MAKFVLFLLLVIWLWHSPALKRWRSPRQESKRPNPTTPTPTPHTMVQCAHCGVHLPRSEALLAPDQQPYCSPEHQRAGQNRA